MPYYDLPIIWHFFENLGYFEFKYVSFVGSYILLFCL